MAEYKGIKGFKVQYLDQDPVPTVAGWSAGGNMATARNNLAGAGTQTAGLAFGGGPSPKVQQKNTMAQLGLLAESFKWVQVE
jgi:hypothetical protein